MMFLGFDCPNLLALRVKFLLLYSLVIIVLISKEVESGGRKIKSTSRVDIPSRIIPPRPNLLQVPSSKSVSKLKCSKLNDDCFERVSFNVYVNNDKFIQSSTTVTSISDADVTAQEITTTIVTTISPTNITNPEEVNEIKIEDETTKAQAKTTIMTSNRGTVTGKEVAHLREGSHYQTLAKSKSKNLVKLENEKTRQELKMEQLQQPRHSIRTSTFTSQTLPYNSSASAAKLNLPSITELCAGHHHKLVKRLTLTQQAASNVEDKSTSNSVIIKAVLGHRLTIPCSNLSLSEITNFANPGGKVITAGRAGNSQQGSSSSTATTRRQNQRLRQSSTRDSPSVRTVANGQGISLIVWHKDDKLNSPVFSADARGASSLREAKQQTNYESLRGRARLEESTRLDSRGLGSTPALVIEEVIPEDAGIYTCTIEFHKAPTQTHQAHVELINPPKNMIIRDDSNMLLAPGLIGPYNEDATLTLTCAVNEPGEPATTQISWWQLQSVSALPFGIGAPNLAFSESSNGKNNLLQANRSHWLSRALSFAFDDNHKVADYLTTITLEQAGSGASPRDYFVALHHNSIGHSLNSEQMVLPFSDGSSLKRWVKVQTSGENSLQTNAVTSPDTTSKPQSSLQLNLARTNLGDEYLCLANNNDLSPPLNSSVKINMNLKPIEVKIINKQNYVFKLNQKLVIECKVYGSKPSPKIRWFKGNKEIQPVAASGLSDEIMVAQNYISEIDRDTNSNNTNDNNSTKVSYLTLIPKLSDNQQSLICSAHNPSITNNLPISDSIIMNVQFAAQLTLQFGANIKSDAINLGSDVYMDCNIRSNPPIDDLIWLFNGQALTTNVSAGIIISNQSLVLQCIRVEHRGQYQCLAQNAVGKSESNKLDLRPKFAPICDYSATKTRYEVAVNQPVKIDCNVLAEPADDIHFVWQFNQTLSSLNPILDQPPNSAALSLNSYRVDEVKQYETNFTKSYVIFTPKTKRHYAQFLCSASNSIGKQEKPCVISVFPSDLPEPVFGCFTDDVTKNSFSIHCQARVSSSSRQNYLLELYATTQDDNNSTINKKKTSNQQDRANGSNFKQREEDQNGADDQQSDFGEGHDKNPNEEQQQQQLQVKKMSSETSTFLLKDLKPDTSYNALIYVQNSKGRSAPFYHQITTLAASASELNNQGGHIEFVNKHMPAEANLADKLISYLPKMSDYLASDNTKPLIGIGLAILLCTISVIVLTFVIARSCRPKVGNRKRTSLSDVSNNNKNKLSVFDIREPHLDKNVRLEPATPASLIKNNGLAGSGSDTSRETNTESTLISSINHNKNKLPSEIKRKQSSNDNETMGSMKKNSIGGEEVLVQQNNRAVEKCFQQTPMMIQRDMKQHQTMQGLYSKVKRASTLSSPLEMDHSNTPQVSIKSSSDCTSNNDMQQVDNPDQFYRDQLLVKCRENQLSEPVYLINGPPPTNYYSHRHQNYHHLDRQQSQPLRLLDPTSFWPYSDPGEQNGGNVSFRTQLSSAETGDSFERTLSTTNNLTTPQNTGNRQLIKDHAGSESVTPIPFNFLPSSMSIPVSLGDCFQQLDRDTQQRRMSQNILSGDLCIANANNGSYLTLTPDDHHHARCLQQQTIRCGQVNSPQIVYDSKRQPITSLLPPENFNSHHALYYDDYEKQKNSLNECSIDASNPGHYCTQTLNDTFRQSHARVSGLINNQTTDAKRNSYDGKQLFDNSQV